MLPVDEVMMATLPLFMFFNDNWLVPVICCRKCSARRMISSVGCRMSSFSPVEHVCVYASDSILCLCWVASPLPVPQLKRNCHVVKAFSPPVPAVPSAGVSIQFPPPNRVPRHPVGEHHRMHTTKQTFPSAFC